MRKKPGRSAPRLSVRCRAARRSAAEIGLPPEAMSAQPQAKGQTAAAVSAELPVQRWTRGTLASTTDTIAEERPVALVYHDVPHVVMLATPADLEDYAY